MVPLCIYHANCADGFTAAWAVRASLGDRVEFLPASYGSEPPDVAGRDVIIVDFSYPRATLERMAEVAASVLVLDHHETAQEALRGMPSPEVCAGNGLLWDEHRMRVALGSYGGLPAVIFDMNRSGAQIAWDVFVSGPRSELVEYVADRDLWRWALPGSEEINAAISLEDMTWEAWDRLAMRLEDIDAMAVLLDHGAALLRKQKRLVDEAIRLTKRDMVIGGRSVPVANVIYALASETGNAMCEDAPFAATYFDGPDGRRFSLRSRKDGGSNVAAIARQYGGGGHRNAAGFTMPIGWEGDHYA